MILLSSISGTRYDARKFTLFLCVMLFANVFSVACTRGTPIEEKTSIPALSSTETPHPNSLSPTSTTETSHSLQPETPEPTPLLSEATVATRAFTATTTITDSIVLYSTIQTITPTPSPSPQSPPQELVAATADHTNRSNSPIGYWALKIWPDNLLAEPPSFSTFYGAAAASDDLSRYFFNFRPQPSPNGQYLLLPGIGGYTNPNGDLGTGLWLFNVQENRVRQLLPQAKAATWNPQSSHITYIEDDTLYTLSIDEQATPSPLFTHPDLNWHFARWSPNGRWIAAVTANPHEQNAEGTENTVWIISTTGEPPYKLTDSARLGFEPVSDQIAWSPDSEFLLIRNEVFDLRGQKIVSQLPGIISWLPERPLLLANGDTGFHITGIDNTEIAQFGSRFAPAWALSHDDRQIAYAQTSDNASVNIFVFDRETHQNQLIGRLPTNHISIIRWRRDNRQLILDDGQNESPIWTIDVQPNSVAQELFSNGILVDVISLP